jgi:hypothetical protein
VSIEPGKIAAGDSLLWRRRAPGYSAADGWTLHYALFNAAGAYTVDAAASGEEHLVDVAAAVTAAWTPGRYDWTAYVTHTDGRRQQLFTGVLVVVPDLASGTPYDGRSHARRMLDAIEAVIEKRGTKQELDLVRGSFGGFDAEREPEKLIVWRDKYAREVADEEAAAALGRGERRPRSIKLRFGR